ncbi:DUF2334 domain-containing protein [Candidatus Parcubacteria bacterium]|nr:MAG: DUF2334 domain-containing protein [Candidatus Parcubacteria bacterium]
MKPADAHGDRMSVFARVLVFLCVWLLPGEQMHAEASNRLYLVFRYDDVALDHPSDMDLKVIGIFQSQGVPLTIGVIPKGGGRDGSRIDAGRKALTRAIQRGGVELALHGYQHRASPLQPQCEFRGDRNRQFAMLSEGRRIVQEMAGRSVDIFIPPWNCHDGNTLAALSKVGFKALSSDLSHPMAKGSGLCYVPATTSLMDIEGVVESARRMDGKDHIAVVLMHPFDFFLDGRQRYAIGAGELRKLLRWVAKQGDLKPISIGDLCRLKPALLGDPLQVRAHFLANHGATMLLEMLPPQMREGLLAPGVTRQRLVMRLLSVYSLICLASFFATILLARLLGRMVHMHGLAALAALIAGVGVLVYAWHNGQVGHRGGLVSIAFFGMALGMLAARGRR